MTNICKKSWLIFLVVAALIAFGMYQYFATKKENFDKREESGDNSRQKEEQNIEYIKPPTSQTDDTSDIEIIPYDNAVSFYS